MHIIGIVLLMAALLYLYGAVAAVGNVLFMLVVGVVMTVRHFTGKKKREAAERREAWKKRECARLHYNAEMLKEFKQNFPDDFHERWSEWLLTQPPRETEPKEN